MVRFPARLLLVAVAGLALAGCADSAGTAPSEPPVASPSSSSSATSSPAPSSPAPSSPAPAPGLPAGTSLTVEFKADGNAVTDTWSLECDGAAPVGSSAAPDPAAACAVLAEQGAALFAPADPALACTQEIRGSQRASVSGTVTGEAVDRDFSLHNGCEITRWESLTALLGPAQGEL